MSADNYGKCPNCKQNQDGLKDEISQSYGEIPELEYQKLLSEQNEITKGVNRYSLRENYEIFTDDMGIFYVNYDCFCNICEFKFSFNHDINTLEKNQIK